LKAAWFQPLNRSSGDEKLKMKKTKTQKRKKAFSALLGSTCTATSRSMANVAKGKVVVDYTDEEPSGKIVRRE
jgi:hypothetical protein